MSDRRWLGRTRLRTRAAAAFGGMAFAVCAVLGITTYELSRRYLLDQRQDTASRQAFLDARALRTVLRSATADIPETLRSLQADTSSVLMLSISGRTYSTSVGIGPGDLPVSLLRAVDEGEAARQLVRITGVPRAAVGVPIVSAGATFYELVSLEELDSTLGTLARSLTAAALVTAVAGTALGIAASRRVLQPLSDIAATAAGITAGNLDARLQAESDPDIGPLAEAFNGMVTALQERIERETRFASDASHELQSPLAAIDSAVAIARRRVDDPERVSSALDVLAEKVAGFQQLVLDLLEISRMQAGVAILDRVPTNPLALARSVIEAKGGPPPKLDPVDAAPDSVPLDVRRISQVLANLIDNAGRYGGGATRVEVGGGPGTLRFVVEDEGSGVPEHQRGYIFERFARGDSAPPGGTGLGLSLVAEHVRLHGGKVWVEDAEPRGARFVVELPVDGP